MMVIAKLPRGRRDCRNRIATGHACYERYRAYLKRTIDEQFALFLPV